MMPKVLVHYAEIALKGRNRSYFEHKLADNIRQLLRPDQARRLHGRMLFTFEHVDEALYRHLALIPGIRYFAPVTVARPDMHDIKSMALDSLRSACGPDCCGKRLRVAARRADKSFHLTSPEINREVGAHLQQALHMDVDLEQADITVAIEVCRDEVYISTQRFDGVGGLPVGSSGRGIALLSGGIDSPVAAYLMMKRGMDVTLVHCYNSAINRDFAKIRALAAILARFQPELKLYLVDLEEFQRHVIAEVPAKYRMIIYKRQMLRTANAIARQEKAQALVIGDSLGQVASQTLANIRAIYDAAELPLLSPLIAYDKEEIVQLARRIGSYDTSIEDYCDICSYLVAKHPETHAKQKMVTLLEARLPITAIEYPTRVETFPT